MRLPLAVLLSAAAGACAASLQSQIGTIPAFLELQHQYFTGPALDPSQTDELIQLAQSINSDRPADLKVLVGTTTEGQEFSKNLLQGSLPALQGNKRDLAARAADSQLSSEETRIGLIPLFINLYQVAAKPSAAQTDVDKLVQLGRQMLSGGYTEKDLRVLLGTDAKGKKLLRTIAQSQPKRSNSKARSLAKRSPRQGRPLRV